MKEKIKKLLLYKMKFSNVDRMLKRLDRIILKQPDKEFIRLNKNLTTREGKKIILIEITQDYSFLVHNYFLLKEKIFLNKRIIGIWTQCIKREKGILNLLKFFLFYFLNLLEKNKWAKLYKAMGIEDCIDLNNNLKANIFDKSTEFIQKNLKINKKELITKIEYKKIKIGDLIYDYFLRYYLSGTFDCSKKFQFKRILNYVEHSFDNLNQFFDKNKKDLEYYIPQYAGYIHHGIPVRFFLKKNIKTIGGITSCQYSKKFTNKDFHHVYNPKFVKNNFDKLRNKNEKRKIAKKLLLEKFKGKINSEYSYMRKSYYDNKKNINAKNIDILIFLPNFVDAPHCYGKLVFNDFQEWLTKTLEYLTKIKNLKIGIKVHPNSLYVSRQLTKNFKDEYSGSVIWIDSNISNKKIFTNKVLFGLSPYGTVLHELAYHNIIPISAGDNPYMSFDFVNTPKNKSDYFNLIDRAIQKKIKFKKSLKKELEESYYMFFLHDNDYIKNYSRKFDLRKYQQGSGINDIGVLKKVLKDRLIK